MRKIMIKRIKCRSERHPFVGTCQQCWRGILCDVIMLAAPWCLAFCPREGTQENRQLSRCQTTTDWRNCPQSGKCHSPEIFLSLNVTPRTCGGKAPRSQLLFSVPGSNWRLSNTNKRNELNYYCNETESSFRNCTFVHTLCRFCEDPRGKKGEYGVGRCRAYHVRWPVSPHHYSSRLPPFVVRQPLLSAW
jgi:hypothetical protein